jgi:predicted transglutaminase-like cysteine proteinase
MVRLIAVAMVALAAVGGSAFASPSAKHATEFSQSLPPIGFVKFCAANPKECKSLGRKADPMAMTPAQWNTLYQVNTGINGSIKPMSDEELYGVKEHWTYPVSAGDCEDYLLLKKRELEKQGFHAGSLLITVVLDEKNEGHAVLTVATEAGDYILDNRRNDILLWNETGYTFLKRQSARDAKKWMALTATKSEGTLVSSQ